jgi:hypothetical protein
MKIDINQVPEFDIKLNKEEFLQLWKFFYDLYHEYIALEDKQRNYVGYMYSTLENYRLKSL